MKEYGRKTRLKISTCRYADEVTNLLARRIKKIDRYKNCKITCYPPMGLDAACSISVKDGEQLLGWLTIVDRQDGFVYNEYKAPKINTYPKDSIGDINGFNIPKKDLPTDIDEAIKLVFEKP